MGRCLREGINILAVQVVRLGITHGQYAGGPGGLIAQLSLAGANVPMLVTDAEWRMTINPAYTRRVPRMAWGQAFGEQYDARRELVDWIKADFDDSGWMNAVVIGPVGTPPWVEMQERPIPFLTEQPIFPVCVFDVCAVQPPKCNYAFGSL